MRIICTNEEKQTFLNAYDKNTELSCILTTMEVGCATKYKSCRECLDKNIDWQIEPYREDGAE